MTETIPEVKIENPEQASTNFFWQYETAEERFNFQTTIRGILNFEQIQAHIKSALAAAAHIQYLGGVAKGKNIEGAPLPSIPTVAEALASPTPPAALAALEGAEEVLTSEQLICSMASGKMYYKISGGRYKKFGVTVWPEVLETTGMKVDKLEAKAYQMPGYRAYYSLTADGKPNKIVRLEKIG
jgi:hypothetical protein